MKPTPVSRFYFSQDEVVAALFPSGIPSKARELRFDGDELVVDFVNPTLSDIVDDVPLKPDPPADEDSDFPGDRPSPEKDEAPPTKVGPNEIEARELCAERGFQTFLEVRTEEAAQKILLEKCKAPDFRSLDTEKYKKAAFRDLVGDYEAWLRGD